MKVCIGITTKNRRDILPDAIESALKQEYSNKEIYVFDDGSTDGTFELRKKYRNLKWERVEKSIGLLEARNRMMRLCDADIFVSLDDDAWFLKNDEVAIAVEYFKKNENIGAIAFDILETRSERYREVNRTKPLPTNFFKGAGHALRLGVVQEAGFYIPFPVKYGHEEKDLGIRILDRGYEIWMLPGVHVWHDYTMIARDRIEQDFGFMVNDLIYRYRRVPLLYLIPVLGLSIYRTLTNKVRSGSQSKKAVWFFIKQMPSEFKLVDRVKISTYKRYRSLSESYLSFRRKNKQN